MKLVYVAGPYRAETEYELLQNIHQAEGMAISVWLAGHAAICPHKNSAHFGGICEDSVFLEGYLELVSRCDAVITCYNWESSSGAKAEVKLAMSLNIPIVHSIAQLKRVLNKDAD